MLGLRISGDEMDDTGLDSDEMLKAAEILAPQLDYIMCNGRNLSQPQRFDPHHSTDGRAARLHGTVRPKKSAVQPEFLS